MLHDNLSGQITLLDTKRLRFFDHSDELQTAINRAL